MDAVPTIKLGVLGVASTDPEVVAVFPSLSATVLPHSQEIRFYRGDDLDIAIQVQTDGDPPDPISLDGAVVRWAAKQGHGNVPTSLKNQVVLGNEAALVYKRSYDPSEIEIVDATRGRAVVHLRREDTMDLPNVPAIWDLEITRPMGANRLPADAMIQLTAGWDVAIALNGLDWMSGGLRPGDIVEAQGRRTLIRKILSHVHAQLDFDGWLPGAGIVPASVYMGRTKTVATGRFVVLGDVVR